MLSRCSPDTMRLVERVHQALREHIAPGDHVIDATMGNGYDTAFLAECVSSEGKVYAFDIQDLAIETTQMVLETRKLIDRCTLIHEGHESMLEKIPTEIHGKIKVAIFNLGYLPHADKSLTTSTGTTISALNQTQSILASDGMISIVAYRGHPGGSEEHRAVSDWIQNSDSFEITLEEDSKHPEGRGPYLWILQKSDRKDPSEEL